MCEMCIDRDNKIKKNAEEFYSRADNNLDNALYDIYKVFGQDSLDTAHQMKMHLYKLYSPEKYQEEMDRQLKNIMLSIQGN